MASPPPLNPYVATHFSIDVECVATGVEHNARAVAQIALVDQFERCLLNVFVKPPEGATVHSYLTPLTGLTKELIEAHGVPLPEAIQRLRAALPTHAVLVGQNIAKDVQWLNLVEGTDFAGMLDLAGLWRVWNAQYNSWSVFGQDHLVKTLLDQAHLNPLPPTESAAYWKHDHALWLHPAPEVLVLADRGNQYDVEYEDTLAFNPGAFATTFSWQVYYPETRKAEVSSLSEG